MELRFGISLLHSPSSFSFSFQASSLLYNSQPSFFFCYVHAFCSWWWKLLQIYACLVRAFQAHRDTYFMSLLALRLLGLGFSMQKGVMKILGGLEELIRWILKRSLISYFLFNKLIVISPAFIKSRYCVSLPNNPQFYDQACACDRDDSLPNSFRIEVRGLGTVLAMK